MKHQTDWEQALDNAVSQLVAVDRRAPHRLPLFVSYKDQPILALKNIRSALQFMWMQDNLDVPLVVACLDRVLDRATGNK